MWERFTGKYIVGALHREVYCASADWMDRNLHLRVETCFPIEDKSLRKRVIKQGLMLYLEDNTQTWDMQPDGSYVRLVPPSTDARVSAQLQLLQELT